MDHPGFEPVSVMFFHHSIKCIKVEDPNGSDLFLIEPEHVAFYNFLHLRSVIQDKVPGCGFTAPQPNIDKYINAINIDAMQL